jgi:DNA-binding NtrC family response regulator
MVIESRRFVIATKKVEADARLIVTTKKNAEGDLRDGFVTKDLKHSGICLGKEGRKM